MEQGVAERLAVGSQMLGEVRSSLSSTLPPGSSTAMRSGSNFFSILLRFSRPCFSIWGLWTCIQLQQPADIRIVMVMSNIGGSKIDF